MRRGGRVVESARLESVFALTGNEGSNPSFSAIKKSAASPKGFAALFCCRAGGDEILAGFDDPFAEGENKKEERRRRDFTRELLSAGLRKVNPSVSAIHCRG